MSKHKKHRDHAHQRREQFELMPARRDAISPTILMLGLSLVLSVVLVYVISSRGQADGASAVSEIAGAGADVALPVATFADGRRGSIATQPQPGGRCASS